MRALFYHARNKSPTFRHGECQHDEMAAMSKFLPEIKLDTKEFDIAKMLIEKMERSFVPENFRYESSNRKIRRL